MVRFFNEIRIIMPDYWHPNIVWALDTGEIPGRRLMRPAIYYHVMEYVPGKDLENLVEADGPLSVTRALRFDLPDRQHLGKQKSTTWSMRDIKPSNILVTPEGQAKLLDFGLARSVGQSAPRSREWCWGASITWPRSKPATPAPSTFARTSTVWAARCSGQRRGRYRSIDRPDPAADLRTPDAAAAVARGGALDTSMRSSSECLRRSRRTGTPRRKR